jgi:hypothetical protein
MKHNEVRGQVTTFKCQGVNPTPPSHFLYRRHGVDWRLATHGQRTNGYAKAFGEKAEVVTTAHLVNPLSI